VPLSPVRAHPDPLLWRRDSQWVRLNLEKDPAPGNEDAPSMLQPPGAAVPRGPGFGPRVIG